MNMRELGDRLRADLIAKLSDEMDPDNAETFIDDVIGNLQLQLGARLNRCAELEGALGAFIQSAREHNAVAEHVSGITCKWRFSDVLPLSERVLPDKNCSPEAELQPQRVWCSGCGTRWSEPQGFILLGVVHLCGDCWRKVQHVFSREST